jgi:hypothetical protein
MLRKTLILSVALSATAFSAMASDLCSVAEAEWRPQAELEAELTAKGWTISNVKKEDGCYEVYGKNEKGEKVEVFIDPKTFAVVGSDD